MSPIRILDLTRVLAGPWATQHLSDQGFEVVKVEPPGGDETRRFGPVVDGDSSYFLAANRDKRSIVLDLKTEAGRRVLDALLAHADVVVENFRPGVGARLGLDPEALHARHPRLVSVGIHAFGTGTPGWSERPGYDLLLQHMGGATVMTGFPGQPPTKHPVSNADLVTALYAVQAILQGLLHRERTGEGQHIVVNMLQAQAAHLAYQASRLAVTGTRDTPRGNSHAGIVPYDVLSCADGWLVVACANDPTWQRLRVALDLPDRPAWRTNAGRVEHREAVMEAVQSVLSGLTVSEADQRLAAARVPAGPVLAPEETLAHPAVRTMALDHPTFGTVRLPGPVLQTATTRSSHGPPPGLGAHRDEILHEVGLGAEVERLAAEGAFGGS
jgi:crotonobetainyl-CoA:carnitine CoA-transferase CaiB-like acyl-CoA transferase